MAYKTEELEAQALEAIKKYNLMFIEEIVVYLPCSEKTFYNHNLQELQTIKEAIQENKIKTKGALRKKWYEADNATLQLALYKIIGTDHEADRLNASRQRHELTGKDGQELPPISIVFSKQGENDNDSEK